MRSTATLRANPGSIYCRFYLEGATARLAVNISYLYPLEGALHSAKSVCPIANIKRSGVHSCNGGRNIQQLHGSRITYTPFVGLAR